MHHIDPVYTVADHEVQHLHRHDGIACTAVCPYISMSGIKRPNCKGTDEAGQSASSFCSPYTRIAVPVTGR